MSHTAGERVLHHREADQHDNQDEAAEQGRADDVVGEKAQYCQRGAKHPDDEKKPGRYQHHGAVKAVRRKINDKNKAEAAR